MMSRVSRAIFSHDDKICENTTKTMKELLIFFSCVKNEFFMSVLTCRLLSKKNKATVDNRRFLLYNKQNKSRVARLKKTRVSLAKQIFYFSRKVLYETGTGLGIDVLYRLIHSFGYSFSLHHSCGQNLGIKNKTRVYRLRRVAFRYRRLHPDSSSEV